MNYAWEYLPVERQRKNALDVIKAGSIPVSVEPHYKNRTMFYFPFSSPAYKMDKTAPFRELVELVKTRFGWTSDLYFYVQDELIQGAGFEKSMKDYYVEYQNDVFMLHVVYSPVNLER